MLCTSVFRAISWIIYIIHETVGLTALALHVQEPPTRAKPLSNANNLSINRAGVTTGRYRLPLAATAAHSHSRPMRAQHRAIARLMPIKHVGAQLLPDKKITKLGTAGLHQRLVGRQSEPARRATLAEFIGVPDYVDPVCTIDELRTDMARFASILLVYDPNGAAAP